VKRKKRKSIPEGRLATIRSFTIHTACTASHLHIPRSAGDIMTKSYIFGLAIMTSCILSIVACSYNYCHNNNGSMGREIGVKYSLSLCDIFN
jgi:hypothetical protein